MIGFWASREPRGRSVRWCRPDNDFWCWLIFKLYLRGDGQFGPLGTKALVSWLNERGYHRRRGSRFGVRKTCLRSVIDGLRSQTTSCGSWRTRQRSNRSSRATQWLAVLHGSGAPGEIRTHDLCLRRAALYPAELRVQAGIGIIARRNGAQTSRWATIAQPPKCGMTRIDRRGSVAGRTGPLDHLGQPS
jgi:hypothetical protein